MSILERFRTGIVVSITAVGVAVLAACAGERPVLTNQAEPAQTIPIDPDTEEIIALLESSPEEFTAHYTITPSNTDIEPTDALVVVSTNRQHISIRDTEFYSTPDSDATCNADGECVDGLNDAYVSDLGLTHSFWSTSAVQRLRVDAARKIGPINKYQTEIAGFPAQCVDIPQGGPAESGSVTFCALDGGVLGRYVGFDSTIELDDFATSAEEDALTRPADETG